MSRIKLNVGGKHFETTRETLELSNYFKTYINRWKNKSSDEIFIDRDGKIFTHILCLLRNPNYSFPSKYLDELEFYQLVAKNIEPSLSYVLQKHICGVQDNINNLSMDVDNLRNISNNSYLRYTYRISSINNRNVPMYCACLGFIILIVINECKS